MHLEVPVCKVAPGQKVVLQLLRSSRDAIEPKKVFPIDLHSERDCFECEKLSEMNQDLIQSVR